MHYRLVLMAPKFSEFYHLADCVPYFLLYFLILLLPGFASEPGRKY